MRKGEKEGRDGFPPDFEADLQKAQQLEEQRQQDPLVTVPLVQLYTQIVDRLQAEEFPTFYAFIKNSLGNAYRNLPTGDRSTNLEHAIACYREALRFRTPETTPLDYADTQTNLGIAYSNLPTQEALGVYTPETTPLDYAGTQTNLGIAYSNLPTGDQANNLAQAIMCYQQALRFHTPEAEPFRCRKTNRILADLYFAQRAWDKALHTYRVAMDIGEQLYRAGLSTESKVVEVSENAVLYPHAAFAAVRCGEPAKALLILEQGRTRLLTEALRLHVPRPASVPNEDWSTFERAGETIRTALFGSTAMLHEEERDPVQSYAAREQRVHAANIALDAAIERVREHAPDFLQAIDLPTAQSLLPDEQTVLVTFCITNQGSMGFVLYPNDDQGIQVVEVPSFTRIELLRLLIAYARSLPESVSDANETASQTSEHEQIIGSNTDKNGTASSSVVASSHDHAVLPDKPHDEANQTLSEDATAALEMWQKTITDPLAQLGQRLLAPILSALLVNIKQILFLPSAELFLLPLHAAPLSDTDQVLVCDHYQVSYVPSITVLANIQAKALPIAKPDLYGVINPKVDAPLFFSSTEGAAIARLFAKYEIDEGQVGTKERVISKLSERTYVHFACHGDYDWEDPTQSGLILANDNLTLADLQSGEADMSSVRLVTLSACETGIVDVFQGRAEQYVGIPAGFMLAGVPCVVSSLWAVDDLSTALLMERFYRNHLSGRMDFAAALREAQLWVREVNVEDVTHYTEQCYRAAKQKEKVVFFKLMRSYGAQAKKNPALRPFAHPYYWAAFTVNGI